MNIHKNKKGFTLTKDDFELNWFSGTGDGGSNRNKCQVCLRLTHKESGITKIGQRERTRPANQKAAFLALTSSPLFKAWLNQKLNEIESGETIEEKVNKEMSAQNLKYEIKVDDKWVEIKGSEMKD